MTSELFTGQDPKTPNGTWHWWKKYADSEPECREWRTGRIDGWWGPRIEVPIAAPVECYAALAMDGCGKIVRTKESATFAADATKEIMGYRPRVVRVSIVPLEIIEEPTL